MIFVSTLKENSEGYAQANAKMQERASKMPGFYDQNSVRTDEMGLSVSYWKDEESMLGWRDDPEHKMVQEYGKLNW